MWYELAGEGYHSPLTKEEISELFATGRLDRADPCKAIGQTRWRTIDELFPLLKYDATWQSYAEPVDDRSLSGSRIAVVAGGGAFLAIALALGWFFLGEHAEREVAIERLAPRTPVISTVSQPTQKQGLIPYNPAPVRVSRNSFVSTMPEPEPRHAAVSADQTRASWDARFEQERLRREQDQREQAALAERMRAQNARDDADKQRAAGVDTIIPLDTWSRVSVGGSSVSVKVHDNDVTSFDIWINGGYYRDLKKNKGITDTGADETYVYGVGNARLFYVWEMSGALNHCRMRVREY